MLFVVALFFFFLSYLNLIIFFYYYFFFDLLHLLSTMCGRKQRVYVAARCAMPCGHQVLPSNPRGLPLLRACISHLRGQNASPRVAENLSAQPSMPGEATRYFHCPRLVNIGERNRFTEPYLYRIARHFWPGWLDQYSFR